MLQLHLTVAQVNGVVVALGIEGFFFFFLQRLQIDKSFAQVAGIGGLVHAHTAGGLINHINGFIGQEAIHHITRGQGRGGMNGILGNFQFVMGLVRALDPAQNLDRFLDAWLEDLHGLEASLQRGIAFDVAPIFIQGGGADALQFTA